MTRLGALQGSAALTTEDLDTDDLASLRALSVRHAVLLGATAGGGAPRVVLIAVARARLVRRRRRAHWTSLAAHVSLALSHLARVDDARRAARQSEREQLSYEIHDTLAQDLVSVVLALEAAREHVPAGADDLTRRLGAACDAARESLAAARRLVWASRPGADAPLGELLEGITRTWSEQTGTRTVFLVTGHPAPVEKDAEALLFWAAREALANVRKHARATEVRVTLSCMEDALALDVHDDGLGIAAARESSGDARGGFGLVALGDRARRLGGRLDVESEPGGGTTLSIQLPRALGERALG